MAGSCGYNNNNRRRSLLQLRQLSNTGAHGSLAKILRITNSRRLIPFIGHRYKCSSCPGLSVRAAFVTFASPKISSHSLAASPPAQTATRLANKFIETFRKFGRGLPLPLSLPPPSPPPVPSDFALCAFPSSVFPFPEVWPYIFHIYGKYFVLSHPRVCSACKKFPTSTPAWLCLAASVAHCGQVVVERMRMKLVSCSSGGWVVQALNGGNHPRD